MLKKRIIPCLDIKDGRTVKGVNFVSLKDAGDPIELAKSYVNQGADELVFLDITATVEKRKTLIELVEKIAAEINIPFSVGGGIQSVEDASALIKAGADKISINSAAIKNPNLITAISQEFGSQCMVLAIDTKLINEIEYVFIHGGRTNTNLKTMEWVKKAEQKGAGEILLTSMNHDGTKAGFAVDLTNQVSNLVRIPVIASGGAGTIEHFKTLFQNSSISAGLAASIFHFGEITIPDLKQYLHQQNIAVRL